MKSLRLQTAASCEVMGSCFPLVLLVLCSLGVAQCSLRVYNLRASGLPSNPFATTDGYVKVFCGQDLVGQTGTRGNDANPWWGEDFGYFYGQSGQTLSLKVYDEDVIFDDLLGTCQRQLKLGTYSHSCYLDKGGTLYYTYSLS